MGGGCHWCTEAVFQAFRGMAEVEQGFARSVAPYDAWSEAVRVRWDADALPLEVLLEAHLRTHSSTSAHSLRGKYRSAVYVEDEGEEVGEMLARLQAGFGKPLVTQVLPLAGFKLNDARWRNYYVSDPERPFCRTHIDPKLRVLRERFGSRVTSPVSAPKDTA